MPAKKAAKKAATKKAQSDKPVAPQVPGESPTPPAETVSDVTPAVTDTAPAETVSDVTPAVTDTAPAETVSDVTQTPGEDGSSSEPDEQEVPADEPEAATPELSSEVEALIYDLVYPYFNPAKADAAVAAAVKGIRDGEEVVIASNPTRVVVLAPEHRQLSTLELRGPLRGRVLLHVKHRLRRAGLWKS